LVVFINNLIKNQTCYIKIENNKNKDRVVLLFKINKKLWSFNFGCIIAGSFVWLVSVGMKVPVPEMLYPHTEFVLDYYSGLVTAVAAGMLTLLVLIIMGKAFKLCTSEHTFWLILPTLSFLALTMIASHSMLISIAYAAIPAIMVMSISAVYSRLSKIKSLK